MRTKTLTALLLIGSMVLAACAVEDEPELAEDQAAIEQIPQAPPAFSLSGRTTSSITMTWWSPFEALSTKVQRRAVGGIWTTVKTYGGTTGSITYEDTGLSPDTRYCYRVIVTTSGGSTVTPALCAVTKFPNDEPFRRARLALVVSDVTGAGTDDPVRINLNDTWWGNSTGLDYSHDDLERSSVFSYDLRLANLGHLHDITNITIQKSGTDSLCLRSMTLLLDEKVAYGRYFGNTPTTCRSIQDVFTVSQDELRASSQFAGWSPPIFVPYVYRDEIRSRIEGIMGDLVWNNPDVYWGHITDEAVDVRANKTHPNWLDIDFDLSASVFLDPVVDIDLTVEVDFVGGPWPEIWELTFESVWFEVDVDALWWEQVIRALGRPVCGPLSGQDCAAAIESHLEDRINASFDGFSEYFDAPFDCPQPTVEVTYDAGLVFGCDYSSPE
jgi:hypothetical protein